MSEQFGRIISVDKDKVTISFQRHSACADCGKCGAGSMDMGFSEGLDESILEVKNTFGGKLGETVKVDMDEGALVMAALMTYIFPILAMIGGYLFAAMGLPAILGTPSSEGTGVLGALVFFGLSVIALRRLNPWFDQKTKSATHVSRI